MAFHSKQDFAALCGLKTKELSVYIGRKKVLLSGDYIDDAIEINREFLIKFKNRKAIREIPISNASDEEKEKKVRFLKPDPDKSHAPNIKDPDDPDDDEQDIHDDGDNFAGYSKSMLKLNKKKLVVEIQKKQREIALLKLREEKLNAIVIPTELVKTIFTQHSRSIATEFKNSIDSIITKIAKKKDLNVNEVAELRGELLNTINKAMDKSVTESKKNIGNIVKEFVDRKEVGERG